MARDRSYDEDDDDDYDRPRRKPKRQDDEWEVVDDEFEVVDDPPPRRRRPRDEDDEEEEAPRPKKRSKSKRRPEITTYMWQSILVTLFCCMPLGVLAIINAARASSLSSIGKYKAAQRAADDALYYVNFSAIVGAIFTVLYLVAAVIAEAK